MKTLDQIIQEMNDPLFDADLQRQSQNLGRMIVKIEDLI